MSSPEVISKGVYSAPQANNAVNVKNYIFIREDGKKYLLLRFENPRKAVVTALELKITLLDGRGRETGVKDGSFLCFGKPKKDFVLSDKIEVDENCSSCNVKVISARYGSYVYTGSGNSERVDYSASEEEKFNVGKALDEMSWESVRTAERTVKHRILISVVACILIAAVIALTVFQLVKFKGVQETFLYSGVEYAFEDGDKSDGTNVFAVGYNGTRSSVTVPEEIGGHRVTGISQGAFEGNARIRSLNIEGEITIGNFAFSKCKNLENLNMEKVVSVGDDAFSECTSLKSVTAGNLAKIGDNAFAGCNSLVSVGFFNDKKTLSVGRFAFEDCASLKEAVFGQTISYPTNYSLFRGCYALEKLELKNFDTKNGSKTLTELFGVSQSGASSLSLREVSIDSLNGLSQNFLANAPVQSVKISSLSSLEIPANAFYNCVNLNELSLPVQPVRVGENAFYGCKLASFDFSQVTYIGSGAFSGTLITEFNAPKLTYLGKRAFFGGGLTNIVIPKTLGFIEEMTFAGCNSLTSVNIPQSIASIGKGAFASCGKLESLTLPFIGGGKDENDYLGYIFGADSPKASRSYIVRSLKQVTVKEISSVPDYAFYGASGLQTVELSESIKEIGSYAFGECASLADLPFSDSLKTIGEYAFSGCASLTSVTVPDSVTSIGEGAFSACGSLTEYAAPFVGGSSSEKELIYVFGDIPVNLEKVTVTKADSIGERAFESFYGLEEIILPDNLKRIGDYAFSGCSFAEINLPESVSYIGDYAFSGCNKLLKITIPSSVEFIGEYSTFNECYRLWEIWNLSGLRVWAPNAQIFTSTDVIMQKFTVDGFEMGYSPQDGKFYLLDYPQNAKSIILPSSFSYSGKEVEGYEIPTYLFNGDENITSLVIPKEVTRIGEHSFENCTNLENVDFSQSKITEIEIFAFSGCASLKALSLPDSVENIDQHAFSACGKLEEVSFGKGLKVLGANSFSGCASLVEANIPEGLTVIENCAFRLCDNLREVTLPSTLTFIQGDGFEYCPKLKLVRNNSNLKISAGSYDNGEVASNALYVTNKTDSYESAGYHTVKNVVFLHYNDDWTAVWSEGNPEEIVLDEFEFGGKRVNSFKIMQGAFSGNSHIKKVVIGGAVKEIGEAAFMSCSDLSEIDFSRSTLESISSSAFAYCTSVKNLVLPSTLKTVGDGAFRSSGVETLQLPEGLTEISNNAFNNCLSLAEAELPSSLKTVNSGAFGGCYSLKNLKLNSGLEKIGYSAFSNCYNITEITLPQSLESIEQLAFYGCTNLRVIYNFTGFELTAHSPTYGYVAYNALAIFKNSNDRAEFSDDGDFKFVKIFDEWYLYGFNGYGEVITLPSTVMQNGYTIKNYAFENYNVSQIVIPNTVKRIEDKAFSNYYFTVYFTGVSEEWNKIRPSALSVTTCYYYVPCVHNGGEWTYINGNVSTTLDYYGYEWVITKQPTCAEEGEEVGTCPNCEEHSITLPLPKTQNHDFEWTVTREATCTEHGEETGVCKLCGAEEKRDIPPKGHDLDENGVCKICGFGKKEEEGGKE